MNAPRPLAFSFPFQVDQRLGLNGRLHWRTKKKRLDKLKLATRLAWCDAVNRTGARYVAFPLQVTLTRVGPKAMDGDNNQGCLKSVRDVIAALLKVDDGDERVRWAYAQRKGPWAVDVLVEEVKALAGEA